MTAGVEIENASCNPDHAGTPLLGVDCYPSARTSAKSSADARTCSVRDCRRAEQTEAGFTLWDRGSWSSTGQLTSALSAAPHLQSMQTVDEDNLGHSPLIYILSVNRHMRRHVYISIHSHYSQRRSNYLAQWNKCRGSKYFWLAEAACPALHKLGLVSDISLRQLKLSRLARVLRLRIIARQCIDIDVLLFAASDTAAHQPSPVRDNVVIAMWHSQSKMFLSRIRDSSALTISS